mgnify:CR=1 FL=1
MRGSFVLSILLACHLLAGCVSPRARCRIAVANATDAALSSVVVRDEAGTVYAFAGLSPHCVAPYVPARSDMGASVIVEVTSGDGVVVTNAVRLDRQVPCTLDVRVLFQVQTNAQVRAFVLQTRDDRSPTLRTVAAA